MIQIIDGLESSSGDAYLDSIKSIQRRITVDPHTVVFCSGLTTAQLPAVSILLPSPMCKLSQDEFSAKKSSTEEKLQKVCDSAYYWLIVTKNYSRVVPKWNWDYLIDETYHLSISRKRCCGTPLLVIQCRWRGKKNCKSSNIAINFNLVYQLMPGKTSTWYSSQLSLPIDVYVDS